MVRNLDSDYLHKLFYVKEDRLYWRERPLSSFKNERCGKTWNTRFANKQAGTVCLEHKTYYIIISISGKRYYEHRIMWQMFIGNVPDVIDHIDGDGQNNKLSNLRDGTEINMKNIRKPSTNTSGIIGVHWSSERKKWVAQGQKGKSRLSLGRYTDFFEACCARKSWEFREGYSVRVDR